MWPSIYDSENHKTYDLPSKLLEDRIILLNEEINDNSSAAIVAQLLTLEAINPDQPITMYINSPGGSVTAGFAIYDIMNNIKCPIITIANGIAASMAAIILSSGSKGKRYALPNASIMIHQPLGSASGQATEIKIAAERILKLKDKLNHILANNTNKNIQLIENASDRDNYLSPEDAKELGIIDEIIYPTNKL